MIANIVAASLFGIVTLSLCIFLSPEQRQYNREARRRERKVRRSIRGRSRGRAAIYAAAILLILLAASGCGPEHAPDACDEPASLRLAELCGQFDGTTRAFYQVRKQAESSEERSAIWDEYAATADSLGREIEAELARLQGKFLDEAKAHIREAAAPLPEAPQITFFTWARAPSGRRTCSIEGSGCRATMASLGRAAASASRRSTSSRREPIASAAPSITICGV